MPAIRSTGRRVCSTFGLLLPKRGEDPDNLLEQAGKWIGVSGQALFCPSGTGASSRQFVKTVKADSTVDPAAYLASNGLEGDRATEIGKILAQQADWGSGGASQQSFLECRIVVDALLDVLKKRLDDESTVIEKVITLFEFEASLGGHLAQNLLCARQLNWDTIPYSFTLKDFIDLPELEAHLHIARDWVLPSLYGALGAALYTIWFWLNPICPPPTFGRTAMRVLAGTFGGVAVVRFVTPDIANMVNVSLVSFSHLTLAFLVGFSIEIVLGWLGRKVTEWSVVAGDRPAAN